MARCTKIINADSEEPKYIINVKQFAKFVVDLAESVAPTDIEEGMRVGVDRTKYQIHIPLPPKIDPSVTMMQVEDKPDVTYSDVGGCKDQIEKLREVVELPLLHVRIYFRFCLILFKNISSFLSQMTVSTGTVFHIIAGEVCKPWNRTSQRCSSIRPARNW